MSGYIGNIPVPQATQSREVFTATSGQTTFATVGYPVGFVDVWLNGVKLVAGTDFTATNGSDVVLTVGAATGDTVEVISNSTFEVNSQTFTGTTTLTGDLQATTATFSGAMTGTDLYLSGGVYLGGTGAANLLDDYEEGSWTPVLRTADSSTEPSYNVRQGDFVKIGRFVYVSGRIYAASTGPTGTSLEVHGLPFIANLNASLGWYGGATLGYYGNIASPTANSILVLLGPENNNTRMRFHWVTVGGSGQTTSYGYNVVSGTDIYFSVSYMTT